MTRPHPPILIGGAGEKKTLRLVALYAWARNLCAGPDLPRKLDVLRGHCDAGSRDYDKIEKTVSGPLDPGPGGEHVNALTSGYGVQTVRAVLSVGGVGRGPAPPGSAAPRWTRRLDEELRGPIEATGGAACPVSASSLLCEARR